MGKLKRDVINTWYYESQKEAEENDVKKSVGHTLVIDGVLKSHEGQETDFPYIESNTEVEE